MKNKKIMLIAGAIIIGGVGIITGTTLYINNKAKNKKTENKKEPTVTKPKGEIKDFKPYFATITTLPKPATSKLITNDELKNLLNIGEVKNNTTDKGHTFLVNKGTLVDDGKEHQVTIMFTQKNKIKSQLKIKVILPRSIVRDTKEQPSVDALKVNFDVPIVTIPQQDKTKVYEYNVQKWLDTGKVKLNITDKGHSFSVNKGTLTDNNVATDVIITITHKNGATTTKTIKVKLPKAKETIENDKIKAANKLRDYFTDNVITLAQRTAAGITKAQLKTLLDVNTNIKLKVLDEGHSFIVVNTPNDDGVDTNVRVTITHTNGKTTEKTFELNLPISVVTHAANQKIVDDLKVYFTDQTIKGSSNAVFTIVDLNKYLNTTGDVNKFLTKKGFTFTVNKGANTSGATNVIITITDPKTKKTSTKPIKITIT